VKTIDESRRAKALRTGMLLAGAVAVYMAMLVGYMVLR
jgi:chromate transport protein ChrA